MTDNAGVAVRPAGPIGRTLFWIAVVLAIIGGLLSCVMAVIVTVSVTGRYLFNWPVPGDYDIVGILCGCAIFSFLPYCQLKRGNVLVDFFTTRAPPRVKAPLDAVGTFLYLAVAVMFTWRLYYGALEMRQVVGTDCRVQLLPMVDDPVRYLLHDRFDPRDHVYVRPRPRGCGEGRIKSPAESDAMSDLALGAAGFGVLFVLIALRVPIGVGMIAVGMVGYALIAGTLPLLSFLKTEMYWRFSSFDFSVIPLFLIMGNFANRAGITAALFRATSSWIGHFRGGLAMAAIGGCAAFGTISGSSLATAAMMGQVSLPELRRYKYASGFATGALAAGGTLGILIPPSIPLIIYAIMVEGNIVQLFQGAFVPGVLATVGYLTVIFIVVRIDPAAGPAGRRATSAERWAALSDIWTVAIIFLVVMGGIYSGIFTPTEGAGIGAMGTFLVAIFYGGMRLSGFIDALLETAITSAMIFLILLGAGVFNAFLGFSQLPIWAAEQFQNSGLAPYTILIGMIILYLFLGCIMDSLAMILITIPIFWPIIAALDFGLQPDDLKLWFGIITLSVVEIGLITPPVGLNVFVINSLAKDVPMIDTFRGVVPFLASDLVRVTLIVGLPILSLFLPKLFGG